MIDEREMETLRAHRGRACTTPSGEIIRRGRRLRRRTVAAKVGGSATALAAVVVILVALTGGGRPGYQVRFADGGSAELKRTQDGGFPHLLIEGWQVSRADDQARPLDGSGVFHSAETTFFRRDTEVTLHMTEGDTSVRDGYVDDRANSGDGNQSQRTVLGRYPATVTDYKGSTQTSAIWFADQVVYELMLETGDRGDFFDALGALRVVDNDDAWEAALPESAVTPEARGAVVDQMLADIPLPPDFDVAPLRQSTVATDRTQLGVKVAGSVACGWIDRWLQGRDDGDETAAGQATQALGTSRNWQVFKDMQALPATPKDWDKHSDYPLGIWKYADAMASGEDFPGGREISAEASAEMICRR
jgi:hypothetical protein